MAVEVVAFDANVTMSSTSRGEIGDDCDHWTMTTMTSAAISARNSTTMRQQRRMRIDNLRVAFRLK